MSNKLAPVSRSNLIARLKQLGFQGPFSGGKHQFLVRGAVRLTLPNPHCGDIGPSLLSRLLQQARVERDEWGETA